MARPVIAAGAVALAMFGQAAADAVPLEPFVSPVYDAPGSTTQIAHHGATCLAQVLAPGVVNAPTILNADYDAGVVVANNAFEYVDKGFIPTTERGRSKVTLEAKDGRFRLTHTSIEQLFYGTTWTSYKVAAGHGAQSPLGQALAQIDEQIAACVKRAGANPSW